MPSAGSIRTGPVKRVYESGFFERSGTGNLVPFLTWPSPGEPLVVSHPRLAFDPGAPDLRQSDFLSRSSRFSDSIVGDNSVRRVSQQFIPREGSRVSVFHEGFRVSADISAGLPAFLHDSIAAARLRADELGWCDTGFWAAESPTEHSIGIAERGAIEWLRSRKKGLLCYVLANAGELIVITCSAESATENFEVDLYANNLFQPFGESRRIVHRGLAGVGRVEHLVDRVIALECLEPTAHGRLRPGPDFGLNPTAVVRVKPSTIHRKETFYYCVVIEHRFASIPWRQLSGASHFLATLNEGYWVDRDFTPGTAFTLWGFSPLVLRTCVVLDLTLQLSRLIG